MEKIENQQLKEEIKDFAVNQLNRCKTFTDVFGKKFARTCLNRNVNKVYTNIESRNNIGGFYKASDYSINLCISGENGQKCTIEQILKNEENKAIVFHELVHALLRKDYKNFNCGTGIDKLDCKDVSNKTIWLSNTNKTSKRVRVSYWTKKTNEDV